MPNFNSIGSGVSEPQVAENRYLPLTVGIAPTTVYALTGYTVTTCITQHKSKNITTVGASLGPCLLGPLRNISVTCCLMVVVSVVVLLATQNAELDIIFRLFSAFYVVAC